VPEWAVLTLRIALAVAGDNSIDADQQFVGRWARAAEAVTDTVRQRLRNRPQCSILTLSGLLRCSSKEAGSCESRRRPGLRDRPKRATAAGYPNFRYVRPHDFDGRGVGCSRLNEMMVQDRHPRAYTIPAVWESS
jgi:hypothetical protein